MTVFIAFELVLLFFLAYSYYLYVQQRRKNINDFILFKFCDKRRELMALARNDEIDVRSPTFKFLYCRLSILIRYTRDYRFLSDSFLKFIEKNQDAFVESKDPLELKEDAKRQGEKVFNLFNDFLMELFRAICLSDPWFPLKFELIEKRNRIDKERKARIANERVKSWYDNFTGSLQAPV